MASKPKVNNGTERESSIDWITPATLITCTIIIGVITNAFRSALDNNFSRINMEIVSVKSNLANLNDNTLYNNGKINKIYNIVEQSDFDYLQCTKLDSDKSNCVRMNDENTVLADTPNGKKLYYSEEFLKSHNDKQTATGWYDCINDCPVSVSWSYNLLRE